MTVFLNRMFLTCGRPPCTLTKYVVTWIQQHLCLASLIVFFCALLTPGICTHLVRTTRRIVFSFVPCFLLGARYEKYAHTYPQYLCYRRTWFVSTVFLSSFETCFLPGTRYKKYCTSYLQKQRWYIHIHTLIFIHTLCQYVANTGGATSTNQLHVFAFQVGRSVWLNKDYYLNTSFAFLKFSGRVGTLGIYSIFITNQQQLFAWIP